MPTQLSVPAQDAQASPQAVSDPAPDTIRIFLQAFALHQQGRLDEAQAAYQQVLDKTPEDANALHLLGVIALQSQRPELAVKWIKQSIHYQPDLAAAHSNLGAALKSLKRLDEAIASYERAIELDAQLFEAHHNRGRALEDLFRLDEALVCYDQALNIQPGSAETHINRANVLKKLNRPEDALASYEQAMALKPNTPFLRGTLIHARQQMADWAGLEDNIRQLQVQLENREQVTTPFIALTLFDSPGLQEIAAQTWVQAHHPLSHVLGPLSKTSPRSPKEKIRLGYYSADFHDHATTYLIAELFELHDRQRFKLIAFSMGPAVKDGMQQRVERAFDSFIDVQFMSDVQIAQLSRQLEIDVAIDLKGHTLQARAGIFALRCAPIQVNYLGYPGTMGANYMDYLIADRILIPEADQVHYAEKIVYLPHTYQANDSKRTISNRSFSRHDFGLPVDGFVFCCFNSHYKITPPTFDSWMRILQGVQGSVLWLLGDNPSAKINLQKEARARGVAAERLVFGKRMPLPEHLARHRLADLFLDTWPCNAHTTASDALWAGLPVLTKIGNSLASRVAASLLHAMDLTELITMTPAQYEQLAVDLACSPARMSALKEKIAHARLNAPLFDSPQLTRDLEKALEIMWQRHEQGLPPAHLQFDTDPP